METHNAQPAEPPNKNMNPPNHQRRTTLRPPNQHYLYFWRGFGGSFNANKPTNFSLWQKDDPSFLRLAECFKEGPKIELVLMCWAP